MREPPAGYTLSSDVDGLWLGRPIEAAGVIIIPAWEYRTQDQHFEMWTGKGTENEAMVKLSPIDAVRVVAELAAAARGVGA